MAALLPNPKNLSPHSLLDFRSLLLHSSPRLTLATGCEKPIRVSSISFRRRRECGISFASRPRRWTASTTSAVDPENVKEDCNEEEEEEDEDFVPFREMKRWLQNKPAGFGEGKTYDTTVEEKILEEFEQSTKNQPAKKKPLVGLTGPTKPMKSGAFHVDVGHGDLIKVGGILELKQFLVTDAIKSDNEVRVGNLPKKRNIDRDLWNAFKEFRGITTISPAVTGNKKTRDPVCRGFAFVGFESGDAAYSFVPDFVVHMVIFAKVKKLIKRRVRGSPGTKSTLMSSHGRCGIDKGMYIPVFCLIPFVV
ncbi:hypothetical protein KSP40_PGU011876 [Platanthera guangdongensis]|uniref:RRM domain-containing protein n=1 Tax=Platanthera guangdongensis TaxID=2320717 RepID=A0ABR2N2R2_9ASPA